MLDSTKQEERDLMILRITSKANTLQEELRKCQLVMQRLNDLREENPKDMYGDEIPQPYVDKHFTKSKVRIHQDNS